MSTLLIRLPQGLPSTPLEYDYAVSHDGLSLASRGSAPLAQLPALSGAGHELVLLLPVTRLSWHRIQLPTRVSAAQLRPALHALLEDTVLDDPAELHIALGPEAETGGTRGVVACDRAWLLAHVQAFESRGWAPTRIVPEFEPASSGPARLHFQSGPTGLQVVWMRPEGVCVLPWSPATLQWIGPVDNLELSADAASARAAQADFQQSVPLLTYEEIAQAALRSPWNLAQFELARSGAEHRLRQLRRAWTTFYAAPEWRAARGLTLALLVSLLLGLNAHAWHERQLLSQKRAAQKAVLQQTFPEVTVILDPVLQMERQLSQLQQSSGRAGASDLDTLLAQLASSPVPLARPQTLDYRDGALRVSGITLNAEQSDLLAAHLRDAGYTLSSDASSLTLRFAGGTR